MTVGERIKTILDELNLGQNEFAERLMVRQSAISQWVNNKRQLSEQVLYIIKREYNVNPLWLLTGHGEMFLNEQTQQQIQSAKDSIPEAARARLRERENPELARALELVRKNPKVAKLVQKLGLLGEESLASVTGYIDALLEKEKRDG